VPNRRWLWILLALAPLLAVPPAGSQTEMPPPSDATPAPEDASPPPPEGSAPAPPEGTAETAPGAERTPPRLSFVDGEVSFWRQGATAWAPARVNTPLAPGDQLYAGPNANLELQVGPRAFVRAGAETQLGLESLEPDYDQYRVASGHLSLDLRSLPAAHTIEVDTPNAAFTIEHTGYYRVEVGNDATTFISRRGGRATVTTASGQSDTVAPSEEVVVSGSDTPQVATYAAPDLDTWDNWNYQRTDQQIDAASSRYVPDDVYGADDLDHHGSWRVVPTYGAVWVPSGVPAGWAPYSLGRWIWDPFYGWTWVDDQPWGWAPFHYGRWVFAGGYWGWAPGPIVARPLYAPALVAFFSSGGVRVGVTFAGPSSLGWVALGWGEPCVPWWGRHGFAGHPHWLGWGGPRVSNTTFVNVTNINVYRNVRYPHSVIAVGRDAFGHGPVEHARIRDVRLDHYRSVGGPLPIKADPERLVGGPARARVHPPAHVVDRRVVAVRTPEAQHAASGRGPLGVLRAPRPAVDIPAPHVVSGPKPGRAETLARPPFGRQFGGERAVPPPPPRYRDLQHSERAPAANPPAVRGPAAPTRNAMPEHRGGVPETRGSTPPSRGRAPEVRGQATPTRERQVPSGPRVVAPPARPAGLRAGPLALPGEPANRVYGGRAWQGQQPSREPGSSHVAPGRGAVQQAPPARNDRGHGQVQPGSNHGGHGKGQKQPQGPN
jgi:hypothetical protein